MVFGHYICWFPPPVIHNDISLLQFSFEYEGVKMTECCVQVIVVTISNCTCCLKIGAVTKDGCSVIVTHIHLIQLVQFAPKLDCSKLFQLYFLRYLTVSLRIHEKICGFRVGALCLLE